MSLLQEALQKARQQTPASLITKAVETKPGVIPVPQPSGKNTAPTMQPGTWYTPPIISQLRREVQAAPPARREISKTAVLGIGILVFVGTLAAFLVLKKGVNAIPAAHRSVNQAQAKHAPKFRIPSLVPEISPQPKLTLTGITVSGDERLALINNQVVGVGDFIREKARVKEIRERSVILEFQGKEFRLTL